MKLVNCSAVGRDLAPELLGVFQKFTPAIAEITSGDRERIESDLLILILWAGRMSVFISVPQIQFEPIVAEMQKPFMRALAADHLSLTTVSQRLRKSFATYDSVFNNADPPDGVMQVATHFLNTLKRKSMIKKTLPASYPKKELMAAILVATVEIVKSSLTSSIARNLS